MPCVGILALADFLRRALRDHQTATVAAFRPQVDINDLIEMVNAIDPFVRPRHSLGPVQLPGQRYIQHFHH